MIGEILRKRREMSGLDLREVAGSLRIRYEYLKALEEDACEQLPADVYTRGYIREYAKFLGIDHEPLVEAYAEQRGADVKLQPEPTPLKRNAPNRKALLVISLILFLGLGLFLLLPRVRTPQRGDQSAEVSLPQVHKENNIPEIPALLSAQGKSGSAGSQQGYVLYITAADTTWLRVETDSGKIEEVLLRPGESKEWKSQAGFNLKVGNAGGIRLVLNNKDLGIPGEKGQVLQIRLPEEESVAGAALR